MKIGAAADGGSGPLILVTDGWLANSGDVASYMATTAALKDEIPGVRVAISSHHRELVGHLYPELDLVPPLDALIGISWPWTSDADLAERDVITRLIDQANLILVAGGGHMLERYRPEGRIRGHEELLERGKRLAFFAQSIGRFREPVLNGRLRAVLNAAELVLVRDQPSLDIVSGQLDDLTKLHMTADQAFLFEGGRHRLPRPRSLLVATSSHPWDRADDKSELEQSGLHALAGSLTRLLDAGVAERITLASTAQGLGEAGVEIEDDSLAGAVVRNAIPSNLRNRVELCRELLTPGEFLALTTAHVATVSMRMHGAIIAAVGGSPVLIANASDKARSLSERTGGRVAAIADVNDLGCVDELARPMITERKRVLVGQNEATEELRESARTNASLVAELL